MSSFTVLGRKFSMLIVWSFVVLCTYQNLKGCCLSFCLYNWNFLPVFVVRVISGPVLWPSETEVFEDSYGTDKNRRLKCWYDNYNNTDTCEFCIYLFLHCNIDVFPIQLHCGQNECFQVIYTDLSKCVRLKLVWHIIGAARTLFLVKHLLMITVTESIKIHS